MAGQQEEHMSLEELMLLGPKEDTRPPLFGFTDLVTMVLGIIHTDSFLASTVPNFACPALFSFCQHVGFSVITHGPDIQIHRLFTICLI